MSRLGRNIKDVKKKKNVEDAKNTMRLDNPTLGSEVAGDNNYPPRPVPGLLPLRGLLSMSKKKKVMVAVVIVMVLLAAVIGVTEMSKSDAARVNNDKNYREKVVLEKKNSKKTDVAKNAEGKKNAESVKDSNSKETEVSKISDGEKSSEGAGGLDKKVEKKAEEKKTAKASGSASKPATSSSSNSSSQASSQAKKTKVWIVDSPAKDAVYESVPEWGERDYWDVRVEANTSLNKRFYTHAEFDAYRNMLFDTRSDAELDSFHYYVGTEKYITGYKQVVVTPAQPEQGHWEWR